MIWGEPKYGLSKEYSLLHIRNPCSQAILGPLVNEWQGPRWGLAVNVALSISGVVARCSFAIVSDVTLTICVASRQVYCETLMSFVTHNTNYG